MLTTAQHPTAELISSTQYQTISVGDILLHYGPKPKMIIVNICKQNSSLASQNKPTDLYYRSINKLPNSNILCDLKNIEEQQIERSLNNLTNPLTTKANISKKALHIPKVGWEICKESIAYSKLRKKLSTTESKTNKKNALYENTDISNEISNNEFTQL
ncbi:unnamed protein product [Didymodactylos carnosus]|uniref:Uncharacterized protein n=1 Tax=Didymodactylos carnosus TaxID=1234261 RepID=A0A814EN54_9BILA|nr:unnamed protein product [Didymodactylos carnosus]CAF1297197.1 unnamed protein product [Didymodactylos carnosus]CAF3746493.1 unnamed protein product [Didymodactylos carnosus]CAF4102546.1 unnamed protein product [Didymodactylos carnosus]